MDKLVLAESTVQQWQNLIAAAERSSGLPLTVELESYLVFLLMRFERRPEIVASVLALEFLTSLNQTGTGQAVQWRDFADKCLLFSGLFPGQAQRRRVQLKYFVDLGKGAYGFLAGLSQEKSARLFAALSDQFVRLMDVLQTTRELDGQAACTLSLLEAAQQWQDLNSTRALRVLRQATGGVLVRVESGKVH